jgi:hypothetical protein
LNGTGVRKSSQNQSFLLIPSHFSSFDSGYNERAILACLTWAATPPLVAGQSL